MSKPEKFDPFRRSVAHVLDVIGEGWSILIIREAFLGTRRFEEFQGRLGIARNILTTRLKNLCANEILDRVPVKEGAKRHEYILTNKGKDMMPLLVALTQWGDRWVYGENNEPLIFLDRNQCEPIASVQVFSANGEVLRPRDIMIKAGPGATPEAIERIKELNQHE
jgi:DNA-binding HxlR family transcriptional regulator